MTNKDKTGNERSARLRKERSRWLREYAYGLSPEGLIGALIKGDCVLLWRAKPKKRAEKEIAPA